MDAMGVKESLALEREKIWDGLARGDHQEAPSKSSNYNTRLLTKGWWQVHYCFIMQCTKVKNFVLAWSLQIILPLFNGFHCSAPISFWLGRGGTEPPPPPREPADPFSIFDKLTNESLLTGRLNTRFHGGGNNISYAADWS